MKGLPGRHMNHPADVKPSHHHGMISLENALKTRSPTSDTDVEQATRTISIHKRGFRKESNVTNCRCLSTFEKDVAQATIDLSAV